MLLQLVVFDLDYTVWQPEMYQINGPPKLTSIPPNQESNHDDPNRNELKTKQNKKKKRRGTVDFYDDRTIQQSQSIERNCIVTDQSGTPITIFDGASHALLTIHAMNSKQQQQQQQQQPPIQVAVASKTDEPIWAQQCMDWLTVSMKDQTTKTLSQLIQHVEIKECDKQWHFRKLQSTTKIAYSNMLFFDNEYYNIKRVSQLGVKCIYTPNGMTQETWNQGLALFDL